MPTNLATLAALASDPIDATLAGLLAVLLIDAARHAYPLPAAWADRPALIRLGYTLLYSPRAMRYGSLGLAALIGLLLAWLLPGASLSPEAVGVLSALLSQTTHGVTLPTAPRGDLAKW